MQKKMSRDDILEDPKLSTKLERAEEFEKEGIIAQIEQLVLAAMQKQASATFYSDSVGEMELVARKTAEEIYKIVP
jgi:hypothetical protein